PPARGGRKRVIAPSCAHHACSRWTWGASLGLTPPLDQGRITAKTRRRKGAEFLIRCCGIRGYPTCFLRAFAVQSLCAVPLGMGCIARIRAAAGEGDYN